MTEIRRPTATPAPYGTMPDGAPVESFTLRAGQLELSAISYGAIITELHVPDRDANSADIVLGHASLDGYLSQSPYFGALVGRCANRIAQGRFTLDGVQYQLDQNDGANHLHGGVRGFDKVVWAARPFADDTGAGVVFSYLSPDRDQHYPGELHCRVTYRLTNDGTLSMHYEASTTAPTIVNLTQHSYFNLRGDNGGDVLGHELTIHADRFTPVDASLIPTGELAPVDQTPFDYRHATPIGARISEPHEQLRYAGGYDHNFVLAAPLNADGRRHAAHVAELESGRTLDIYTSEPGLQFYSGNFLDGTVLGKGGQPYAKHAGFCLETQHFPDSPNRPEFPTVVLRPGSVFRSSTAYEFGVRG